MRSALPKKGMHGGLALCRVSRYSAKFFVLFINFRILSKVAMTRAFTFCQVLFSRWIGAVPNAEIIEVRVEKLLRDRHF
jgi:hypothetical protein